MPVFALAPKSHQSSTHCQMDLTCAHCEDSQVALSPIFSKQPCTTGFAPSSESPAQGYVKSTCSDTTMIDVHSGGWAHNFLPASGEAHSRSFNMNRNLYLDPSPPLTQSPAKCFALVSHSCQAHLHETSQSCETPHMKPHHMAPCFPVTLWDGHRELWKALALLQEHGGLSPRTFKGHLAALCPTH